jgi:hypothetical protein
VKTTFNVKETRNKKEILLFMRKTGDFWILSTYLEREREREEKLPQANNTLYNYNRQCRI